MEARTPALKALIDSRFRAVERFPGLVGDGDVVVWKTARH